MKAVFHKSQFNQFLPNLMCLKAFFFTKFVLFTVEHCLPRIDWY